MSFVIDRLDDFGRGITKVNGKTCFVYNALVNEKVDLKIIREKSKYIEAFAINIDFPSDDRVPFKCSNFLKCGGCNLMHLDYKKQLEFKENKVKNIISKFTKIDCKINKIIPSKELFYRNKVTLKVDNNKIGFYELNSNRLVPISKCYLLDDNINKVIKILEKLILNGIEEIVIRSNNNDEILLCLKGLNIDNDYFLDKLRKIDNIVVIDNGLKKIIKGNDYFIDKINDMNFKVSIDSFFQVNKFQVSNLYNKVFEYANLTGKEKVLDLYCGTGTIGLFLSKKAKEVIGIEINESCVNDANYNKELNKIKNIKFICSDFGEVNEHFNDIDLVVIDPPRSGLSKKAIKNIIDINSKNIIYVSCDPITLARDLNSFKNTYDIKEITPVDMFPSTYHCESVCVLERR